MDLAGERRKDRARKWIWHFRINTRRPSSIFQQWTPIFPGFVEAEEKKPQQSTGRRLTRFVVEAKTSNLLGNELPLQGPGPGEVIGVRDGRDITDGA
jgi:hypothetical protein